jgi:rod shape determining protein RodA
MIETKRNNIDWLLLFFILPILGAGLVTMSSFTGEGDFFGRQLVWVGISIATFIGFSFIDFRFLKQSNLLLSVFGFFVFLLILLFFFGSTIKGAKGWFDLGFFSFQPVEFMKLALILVLAKYFSRRHVEIKNVRHILISAVYMVVPFVLVFLQPDFGSAIIIFVIWFGMTLVSGISKKHLALVIGTGIVLFLIMWFGVLQTYQKNRIMNFLHPLADIQGSGYNAYQSTIAVGSGQFLGKGVGYGTQSRLQFLPEYQTDFIFAAYAEEWGFVGAILLLLLYVLVLWRILRSSQYGASNFEILFGLGMAIMFSTHIIINIGMNIGLLPVTGITLPFMSHGGSHLLTSFMGLGILMGLRKNERSIHKDDMRKEFLGI